MTRTLTRLASATLISTAVVVVASTDLHAQTARTRYESAQAREVNAREVIEQIDPVAPTASEAIAAARAVVAAYEALVLRYPVSGYSDNALFNAAALSETLHQRFGQSHDRDAALRLYRRVAAEYPASSLVKQAEPASARLEAATSTPVAQPVSADRLPAPASPSRGRAKLTAIERTVIGETVRVTLALDREVPYHEETLAGPARVFFDLKGVEASPDLADAVLRFPSDPVRQIRVGRHPNSTVRVVLDLEGVTRHSVYALYNPFRVVVDCEASLPAVARLNEAGRAAGLPAVARGDDDGRAKVGAGTTARSPVALPAPVALPPFASSPFVTPSGPVAPLTAVDPPAPVAPELPAVSANAAGGFSLSRQLGLGVSRIVIDPGHGGHDPGALGKGLNEAALTLDIALRLQKLLQEEPGIDVVLTRRTDVFVPLEERTAIANREAADLFLSIHANASRRASANGVETYFLSFAATPEAEAVAARENSAGAGTMRNLPDIVKAITLNNKLDESRDLAGMVQEALVTRLRRSNKNVRNLGVKKAPFVVLVGAGMPSVLAEVSFLTNKQELQLLKTAAYKQRIAEALHAAVMRYRRSLKGAAAIASQ